MSKILTAVTVKKYRAERERREIPDGGCRGLYLVIQSSGSKSWALRFRRPNGKAAKLTLGPVDLSGKEHEGEPVAGTPLSLAAARMLAAKTHRERAHGRDVIADHDTNKRRMKFEAAARITNTFAAAARDFVEQHAMKKTRRWRDTSRMLGLDYRAKLLDPKADLELLHNGLADRWADKPVTDISARDIHDIIDETKRLGVPGRKRRSDGPTEPLARAMRSVLHTMFDWLQSQRRVESNPCNGVLRPAKNEARERTLNSAEIVKFWRAAGSVKQPFESALKLLLLTGCRREEVGGMRRSELSDDLSTWSLPGSRTKNKKPHVVPLPPLARQIIGALPVDGDLVFGHSLPWSRIKKQLDKAMKVPAWVIHDLRRTFVTQVAELGVAPHVVELCVNHVSGTRGGIAGVYNKSELLPERKAALERWAAHVVGLVEGHSAKVVPMRAG